uniref:Uncharacterized protein n=1 Tax=Oryza punctata TaxID=4537 RepID=A0A0E0MHB9_ORYPU
MAGRPPKNESCPFPQEEEPRINPPFFPIHPYLSISLSLCPFSPTYTPHSLSLSTPLRLPNAPPDLLQASSGVKNKLKNKKRLSS